ncbi:MAG: M23 family metallopeptidase [Lachnospiraceae bacterium]|nr:M23 family metallopeptidase [Lachnospiraceae bacterium]
MVKLFIEVMNMNNRDNTFLQKLKDNAFYLSLGLGLFAILAVVGVYTAQQQDTKVADNELDLNVASDYASIATEEADVVEETNADVSKKAVKGTSDKEGVVVDVDDTTTQEEVASQKTEEVQDMANVGETEEIPKEVATNADVATEDNIPVTVNAGELDFNSEKTIDWPMNGKVILPYSMETTVYFKTLDQYKCNPGMLIQAGVGSSVQNAYLGQVTDVTSDNTYGNLVTLYIGNGYSLVYGQLDTIYVKEGDFVKAGQSLGTVGKPTDSFTEEGCHLFFQMLKEEEPVDPAIFIE